MTVSLLHAFRSAVADAGSADEVGPDEWNAEHTLTQATGKLLGRTTAGTGATEEITPSSSFTFTGGALDLGPTLFLTSGAVLNFNTGDVTITHSANALAFAGGTYSFDGAVGPAANDGAALGSAAVSWADLFLASGGQVSWANGAMNIADSTTDQMFFNGASSGYFFDAITGPRTDDGAPLGSTANKWSDLFLASGAVINFNSGNYTITHSAGALTLNGALSIGTSNALTVGTIELGAASDTTLSRSSAGNVAVEGNLIYRAGGTDVPITDGGTGASTASAAFDNLKQAATTTASGVSELATDAEAVALSDTTRTITPSNLAAVLATDVQTFTSSGTWTKPSAGRFALVQVIGAAGGGARRSAGNGSGGGGGAYFEKLFLLSALGATETVTIGTGGAVQSTDSTDGNAGGTTSFGTHVVIYGGRGGTQGAAGTAQTGGGSATYHDGWALGVINAVGFISGQTATAAIQGVLNQTLYGAPATGATAGNVVQTVTAVAFQGGVGGAGHSTTGPVSGVASTSLNGGDGGAGNGAGAGGNGSSPGGGGGSGTTQGGSGGNGRIIVTVF